MQAVPVSALEGHVAVVTGAGRGIGRAIALRLAADGAAVVLSGRDAGALQDTAGLLGVAPCLVQPADVTDLGQLEALAQAALAAFGRIDVLVANSGIGGPSAPLTQMDPADWNATFAVNVTGVFLSCRAILPTMLAQRRGSVVVIGSMTGKRPLVNRTPYAASKTALIGLVRTLAAEVGDRGVRVNLVSPGAVEGERIEWAIASQAQARGITADQARAEFTQDSPLGRLVTAQEVADAVAFLAGDRASAFTGQDLNVSAGTVMY